MKVKVGDRIGTDVAVGTVTFIGREWVLYEDDNGKEHCSHKENANFWIPAEIEWVE